MSDWDNGYKTGLEKCMPVIDAARAVVELYFDYSDEDRISLLHKMDKLRNAVEDLDDEL